MAVVVLQRESITPPTTTAIRTSKTTPRADRKDGMSLGDRAVTALRPPAEDVTAGDAAEPGRPAATTSLFRRRRKRLASFVCRTSSSTLIRSGAGGRAFSSSSSDVVSLASVTFPESLKERLALLSLVSVLQSVYTAVHAPRCGFPTSTSIHLLQVQPCRSPSNTLH